MKLPNKEQTEAVIAADQLLSFIVKTQFSEPITRKLIEDKITQYYNQLEPDEQAEAVFLEAALSYIKDAN